MPLILGANSVTGGYEVDNSLRFNDGSSDYLSKIITPSGNKKLGLGAVGLKGLQFNSNDRNIDFFSAGDYRYNTLRFTADDTNLI
jgi:hypothetical protein